MSHLQAFFLVGRDIMWLGIYLYPLVAFISYEKGEGDFVGFLSYLVVTALCFLAGAGVI